MFNKLVDRKIKVLVQYSLNSCLYLGERILGNLKLARLLIVIIMICKKQFLFIAIECIRNEIRRNLKFKIDVVSCC